MPFASRGPGGRRARHDSRPEELRAINAVDDAIAKGAVQRHQDFIIALAVEHEAGLAQPSPLNSEPECTVKANIVGTLSDLDD